MIKRDIIPAEAKIRVVGYYHLAAPKEATERPTPYAQFYRWTALQD